MKKYYSEELNPNSSFRADYERTLNEFLEKEILSKAESRKGFISPKEFQNNPDKFRKMYVDFLGFPLNKKLSTPKLICKEFLAKDGNINFFRMQFEVLGGIKFYGLYLEQIENKEKAPFVIAFHGKEGTPELCSSIYMNSANYNHMVRRTTDRGANVFVPQNLLWSLDFYKENYDRTGVDATLRSLGGSITALEVYINSSIISYFVEKENVNENKIGALGLSYGGMYTIFLSAFDTRIKSAYSCSWFCSTGKPKFPDWAYKGQLDGFGNAEIASLICPRALAIAMGKKDPLFNTNETLEEGKKVGDFYTEYGANNKFMCYIFDGEHEFDFEDKGLDFFFANLD